MGGRLDTLQAAVLNVKLKYYQNDIVNRQRVAKKYDKMLSDIVNTPKTLKNHSTVWAQYSIRVKNREQIVSQLKNLGIPTAVHYPKPLHLQECFEYLKYKEGDFPVSELISNEILSLPMNPYLNTEEINFITTSLKSIL